MRHRRITIAQHPDFSNRDDGQREPLFSSAGPKFGRGRKQMDGVRSSLAAALILTAGVLSAAGALTWTATAQAQSSLPARPGLTTKAPSSLQRPQGTPGPDGNNLDVIIGFSNGSNQHAPNVNGGANWANNTEHKFWVYLSQPGI